MLDWRPGGPRFESHQTQREHFLSLGIYLALPYKTRCLLEGVFASAYTVSFRGDVKLSVPGHHSGHLVSHTNVWQTYKGCLNTSLRLLACPWYIRTEPIVQKKLHPY